LLGPDMFDPRKVQLIKEHTLGATAAGATGPVAVQRALAPEPLADDVKARIRAAQAKYKTLKQLA